MHKNPTTILVPGRGHLSVDALTVNRTIMEYDERLRFGFNEENQDYVVYIKMPRGFDAAYFIDGEPVYPIIGFGKEVPTPEEALASIRRADTMEYGMNILNRMNKENAKKTQAMVEEAEETDGEIAEALEYGHRKMGTHPVARIFVPDTTNIQH